MAEPKTRIDPRTKRAVAQMAAQQRYKAGQPPSSEVQAALSSFKEPPSPEQISAVAMELARTKGTAAAIEFETYAKELVIERARAEGERSYAAGAAPAPEVDAELKATGSAVPTEEQIKATSARLAQKSPTLAAQYEAYVRGLQSDRAAAQEGQYSERDLQTLEGDFEARAEAKKQPPARLNEFQPGQAPAPAPAAAPAPRSSVEKFKAALRPLMPWKGYYRLEEAMGGAPADQSMKKLEAQLEKDAAAKRREEEASGGRTQ